MSEPLPKLLITGASGFLGWTLCQKARQNWQVYGTCHQHKTIAAINSLQCDISDFKATKKLLEAVKPAAVIHLAALSDPNFCAKNPEASKRINLDSSLNLAGLCADLDIDFVFTSTDLVFDGQKGNYREGDALNPVSLYGEHKVLAEKGIQECYAKTTICRMPLMYGNAPEHAASFIQGMIRQLKNRKSIPLFTDEFRTPAFAECAADGLLLAMQKPGSTLHLGGPEVLSRYEMGQLLAEHLSVPESYLQPSLQSDVQMAAARPPDVSLNSQKAFALGYQPISFKQALTLVKNEPF